MRTAARPAIARAPRPAFALSAAAVTTGELAGSVLPPLAGVVCSAGGAGGAGWLSGGGAGWLLGGGAGWLSGVGAGLLSGGGAGLLLSGVGTGFWVTVQGQSAMVNVVGSVTV